MKSTKQLGYMPLILAAAAVFSAISFASCSANVNDSGGRGGDGNGPNLVSLSELYVYISGEDVSKSLITFDAKTNVYSAVIPDSAIVADGEAAKTLIAGATGVGTTTIKIKQKSGGNPGYNYPQGETPKQTVTVSGIPLPTDENDTEIVFECGVGSWNGDSDAANTFTVILTTPTPMLENLIVRNTSEKDDASKDLIKYSKGQNDYTITAANKITIKPVFGLDQELTVTLKDSKDASETPLAAADSYDVDPDQAGGFNKSVSIKVKYKEKENTYNVTLVPPISNEPVGYRLQTLTISYTADSANKLADFDPKIRKYTLSPKIMESLLPNLTFTATSEGNSKISVTYTGPGSGIVVTGDGTNSVSGSAPMPDTNGQRILKFKVARSDGNSAEWSVTINEPGDFEDWTGTINYTGTGNYTIQPGLVLIQQRSFQGGTLDIPNSTAVSAPFTMEAPSAFSPQIALVQFTDGEGRRMQSVPIERGDGLTVTGHTITINIDSPNKLTYIIDSANGFYETLNNVRNKDLNYSLINDIDLDEYKVNGVKAPWEGPVGYSGHFYGNGYTVRNLILSQTSGSVGLFKSLGANATVENFTVEVTTSDAIKNSTPLKGITFGGVIAGLQAAPLTIRNITVNGTLEFYAYAGTGTGVAAINAGGVIGSMAVSLHQPVLIENCVSNLSIKIKSVQGGNVFTSGIGGLIGQAHGEATTIRNSYSTGNIEVTSNQDAIFLVGGFIGSIGSMNLPIQGVGPWNITIENSYSAGDIICDYRGRTGWQSRTYPNVGGFMGGVRMVTNLTVKNCAAIGNKIVVIADAPWTGVVSTDDPVGYLNGETTGRGKIGNPYITIGRIYGGVNAVYQCRIEGDSEFTNNIAKLGMSTGTTPSGTPNNTAGSLVEVSGKTPHSPGLDGYGIAADAFFVETTWTNPVNTATFSGLGWSSDVWDFSTVPTLGRPMLKK